VFLSDCYRLFHIVASRISRSFEFDGQKFFIDRVQSNSVQSSSPESFLILIFWYWRHLLRVLPRDFHFLLFRYFLQFILYQCYQYAAGRNSWFSHGRYTRSYGTVSSIGLLGPNCKPYMVVHSRFQYISLSTQWQLLAPDRPCAQHVQSTRRMSLTVKRPSNKGLTFQLFGIHTNHGQSQERRVCVLSSFNVLVT
jgi:hypothetical protein